METIDIEEEKIQVNDIWKSAEELREEIKAKIGEGDFEITVEALALKELNSTLAQYTEIQIKLPIKYLEALKVASEKVGKKREVLLREYLDGHLPEEGEEEEGEEEEDEEEEVEVEEEEERVDVEEKGEGPAWEEEEGRVESPEEGEEKKEEKKTTRISITKVRCHKCSKAITVTRMDRPITVTCPYCGAKGRLEQ